MKKYMIILLFLVMANHTSLNAQPIKNLTTGLEIVNVFSNQITIRWRSQEPSGRFAIYYQTKSPIKDTISLKSATAITNSNFTGVNKGETYEYSYVFNAPGNGTYFFAVVYNANGELFDVVARNALLERATLDKFPVILGINSTIQPIFVQLVTSPIKAIEPKYPSYTAGFVITSLNFNEYENAFQLKWSVYPKTLPQYIFSIYRSKYPIAKYGTPVGLPVYVQLTNEFTFKDLNISEEVPYYYAVVGHMSEQWDVGINVFSTPAILLKKSPPFYIKPQVEIVRKREVLPFSNTVVLSEAEIEQAVQQTLQNLQIIENTANSPVATTAPSTTLAKALNIDTNSANLQQQDLQAKANFFLFDVANIKDGKADLFAYKHRELHKKLTNTTLYSIKLAKEQHEAQKSALIKQLHAEDIADYKTMSKDILNLSNEFQGIRNFETKLLKSDSLSSTKFKALVKEYQNTRQQHDITKYKFRSQINAFNDRRYSREKEFLKAMTNLVQKYEAEKTNIIFKAYKNSKLIDVRISLSNTEYYLNTLNKQIEQNRKGHVSDISKVIALQVVDKKQNKYGFLQNSVSKKIDLLSDGIQGEKQFLQDFEAKAQELAYTAEEYRSEEYEIAEEVYEDPSAYENIEWQEYVDNNYEEIEDPIFALELAKNGYNYADLVDVIPDISELPQEVWLSTTSKDFKEKQILWQDRASQIIGDQYSMLRSKWMTPSRTVALTEGRNAFYRGNYKEALYLLNFVANEKQALLLLGQSYYNLGAYRDAFTVFVTAVKMGVPEARPWLDKASAKIVE